MKRLTVCIVGLLMLVAGPVGAQQRGSGSGAGSGSGSGSSAATEQTQSQAAGRSTTASSLSARELSDLAAGRGMGLAMPAELNDYPGPAHALELADLIKLTERQRSDIQVQFDWMKAQAEQLGRAYIAAETALDEAFRSKKIDAARLAELVKASESLRAELRVVHLTAHLETAATLTEQQRVIYGAVRSYIRGKDGAPRGARAGTAAATTAGCGSDGGCCCGGGGGASGGGCGASGGGMSCRPQSN